MQLDLGVPSKVWMSRPLSEKTNLPGRTGPIRISYNCSASCTHTKQVPMTLDKRWNCSSYCLAWRMRNPASDPGITLSCLWRNLGPLILMSLIPREKQGYTVLDLKDTLFSLLVSEVSQPIFSFKWTDPVRGYSGQHTWTLYCDGELCHFLFFFLCFVHVLIWFFLYFHVFFWGCLVFCESSWISAMETGEA